MATPDPRSIRIGTAEREQAVKALGEHFAQGRLEPSEFEERMTAAYAARTASELDGLFDDLPSARHALTAVGWSILIELAAGLLATAVWVGALVLT